MDAFSTQQIMEINEFGEIDAWENYFLAAPEAFRREFGLKCIRTSSSVVSMIPGLNWTFFNRINGLGVRSPAAEHELDEAIAILEKAGMTNYMVQVPPFALPSDIPLWLKTRGFKEGKNWAKVYRGDEPALEAVTDIEIVSIDEKQADEFADIALAAFEMPDILRPLLTCVIGQEGWYHYLGYDGGQAVCTSAMRVHGDVCWLGFGSTLESHRGRGGQTAMFARRISDGLDLNARWFVTETGEDTPDNPNPSYHNMVRAGFRLAYMRRNFVREG